ncbi:MAG: ScpA family protein [Candidatus Diapherotrites archaeon]
MSRVSTKTSSFSEGEEDEYASFEMVDTSLSVRNSDDLVGLIDQPAWKTILISLVKSEKMDPWNIDVKELAQKYLERIRSLQSTDLRLPANAILASAILLKFKARALRIPSLEEADDVEWKALLTEEQLLGGMMPELMSPILTREGKVTLDQLVESIESILEKTKTRIQRERDGRDRPVFSLPFASMNLEEKMKELYDLAHHFSDEVGLSRFSSMMEGRSTKEVIESFLALLFLMNDGKLNAWQESLFGEIFISTLLDETSPRAQNGRELPHH